jgi:molecular chaperone GrpE
VRSPGDKGNFSADIDPDVIAQALKAVEKRTGVEDDGTAPSASTESEGEGASGAPAPDARDQEMHTLKAELELSMERGRDLMQKLKDEHERLLRAAADLENYKKRAQKEKEEIQKFGSEKLLKDMLPVLDNFDRALDHSAADLESLHKGVQMIRKQFEDALGKHGVKAFSAKGEVFDPTRHEAMSSAETTDVPPNHVYAEVLRGFTLNERLVRPALVVVARAPEAPAAGAPATEGEGGPGEPT